MYCTGLLALTLYAIYCVNIGYFISTLVVSPEGLVGVVFGRSTTNTPLLILAETFEGTISSGIGIRRLNDLYDRSLYT